MKTSVANPAMVVAYTADSIIQRDALMALLREAGIDSESPARDLSRQLTSNSIDIAYEGYSAVKKDIFPILVDERKKEEARRLIDKELARVESEPSVEVSHLYRFRAACLYTIVLPVVFHIVAVMNLIRHYKSGEAEKFWTLRNILASAVALTSLYLVCLVVNTKFQTIFP